MARRDGMVDRMCIICHSVSFCTIVLHIAEDFIFLRVRIECRDSLVLDLFKPVVALIRWWRRNRLRRERRVRMGVPPGRRGPGVGGIVVKLVHHRVHIVVHFGDPILRRLVVAVLRDGRNNSAQQGRDEE